MPGLVVKLYIDDLSSFLSSSHEGNTQGTREGILVQVYSTVEKHTNTRYQNGFVKCKPPRLKQSFIPPVPPSAPLIFLIAAQNIPQFSRA